MAGLFLNNISKLPLIKRVVYLCRAETGWDKNQVLCHTYRCYGLIFIEFWFLFWSGSVFLVFLTLLFLPLYVCVFSGIMFSLHNLMHCDNCFCCVRDVNRVQFLGNVSLLAYQFCLLVPNALQSAVLGMCAGESNWWRSLQSTAWIWTFYYI